MKTSWIALFFFLAAAACFADSSAKWQVATITEVKIHTQAGGDSSTAVQYDVTLKVGKTEYVVLYAPPDGTDRVRYLVGMDRLVLVGEKTIKYNDLLGTTGELPILRHRQLSAQTKPGHPENKQE